MDALNMQTDALISPTNGCTKLIPKHLDAFHLSNYLIQWLRSVVKVIIFGEINGIMRLWSKKVLTFKSIDQMYLTSLMNSKWASIRTTNQNLVGYV